MTHLIRTTYELTGILQGVGFRPTVARLAQQHRLAGRVRNQAGTVWLELIGPVHSVDAFMAALPQALPPQAQLAALHLRDNGPATDAAWRAGFHIEKSQSLGEPRVSIPADLGVCADCRRDVFDPHSRFYGYAFTTCTNCGPRYTVVHGMPYDRERTTMAPFALCDDCRHDYETPDNRRFHAETIACPRCGPQPKLCDKNGQILSDVPIRDGRNLIFNGQILAVRGLGGFLLVADATNVETVERLRKRKQRPHKPLAVMARNLAVAKRWCEISERLASQLESPQAPIVIAPLKSAHRESPLRNALSPDMPNLGVMLPTTPLHWLLCEPLSGDPVPPFDLLVMTSGNRSAEPIALRNEEALARLSGIADAFLLHDRDINLRNDDSLLIDAGGDVQLWRRARGYAPNALSLPMKLPQTCLALGAHLKNTMAMGFGRSAVLSPHIGDLDTPEAQDALRQVVEELPRFLRQTPQSVAVDMHPDMPATRLGEKLSKEWGVPLYPVQHHHAHAAAVMCEAGRSEALALIYDGTGWGTDGALWGAELLHVVPGAFRRLGSLAPVALPGGEAAIRRPARQLFARWMAAGLSPDERWCQRLHTTAEELSVWAQQLAHGVNAPLAHGAGRLFDAFAASLGLAPGEITYDGQAAIRLEAMAAQAPPGASISVPFSLRTEGEMMLVDFVDAFVQRQTAPPPQQIPALALGFHRALVEASVALARHGRQHTGQNHIVLGGGVMMNRVLCGALAVALPAQGFVVHQAQQVPPGDGGVALGQVCIAAQQM
ncbi:MAG: carbamoyltransferase HypF [Proteobacteria bacterium]|nr:carbamoyltransferase HypF [Pseudomonadota bacterium]